MRYRILEKNGVFYPQYCRFIDIESWRFFYNFLDREIAFKKIGDAKKFAQKAQIKELNSNEIYHEIN